MTRLSRRAVGLLALPLLLACGEDVAGPEDDQIRGEPAMNLEVTPKAAMIKVGGFSHLSAVLYGVDGEVAAGHRSIEWSSSNPGVARVSSNGEVRGVTPGSALIIATGSGLTGQASIRVLGEDKKPHEPEE